MSSIEERYEQIAAATRDIRRLSLADGGPVETAEASISEIRVWQSALRNRPEAVVFAQVISALELGLFALVSGLYRQAYGSLRLAVELVAALSWFSTHRLDLAEWQTGERDLIWKDITNPDEGVLSPRYRKAFFPELNEERKYNGLFKKLYRELSEYVHGNARTWAGPDDIAFDKSLHEGWLTKLETFLLVTNVLLSLRYLQEIDDEQMERLEPILSSRVSQVAAITKYFEERMPAADAGVLMPEPTPSGSLGVTTAARPGPESVISNDATEPIQAADPSSEPRKQE